MPAPGTVEAFQKYLQLQPQGRYAKRAQDMITSLGSTVEMNYKDPNAKTTNEERRSKAIPGRGIPPAPIP